MLLRNIDQCVFRLSDDGNRQPGEGVPRIGMVTESGRLFSAARPAPTQVRDRETTGPHL